MTTDSLETSSTLPDSPRTFHLSSLGHSSPPRRSSQRDWRQKGLGLTDYRRCPRPVPLAVGQIHGTGGKNTWTTVLSPSTDEEGTVSSRRSTPTKSSQHKILTEPLPTLGEVEKEDYTQRRSGGGALLGVAVGTWWTRTSSGSPDPDHGKSPSSGSET